MGTATYAWASITKAVKQADGTLMVYGPATDAGLDRDRQKMNQAWLDKAMPLWKAEGGNIREQHDKHRAVGVAAGLTRDADTGAHLLAAHVVDPIAVLKVENKVLTGFSIGVKEPVVDMTKADAPNGEIVGGKIIEVSLVDRPSNPRTTFTMVKADSADELEPVENPTIVESPDAGDSEADPDDEADGTKVDETDLNKFVSAKQRDKYASSGVAMDNGDFPIPDQGHLQSAIGHLGNYSGDKAAARRHIIARARTLGLTSMLPDDWNVAKADQLIAAMAAYTPDLAKYDEAADIAGAEQAMALIARLIVSEATELANGRMEEARDISILLDAHRALDYFRCREQTQAAQGDGISPSDVPDLTYADTTTPEGVSTIDTPDLVKAAVAEAIRGQEERAKGLESQVATLKAQMAAMPKPGGPALARTTQARTTPVIDQRDAQVQQLLVKAENTQDPVLRRGYRERARELLAVDA